MAHAIHELGIVTMRRLWNWHFHIAAGVQLPELHISERGSRPEFVVELGCRASLHKQKCHLASDTLSNATEDPLTATFYRLHDHPILKLLFIEALPFLIWLASRWAIRRTRQGHR